MVNRTGQKGLLFVGKERFFDSIHNFKLAFADFAAEKLWIVEKRKQYRYSVLSTAKPMIVIEICSLFTKQWITK